MVQNFEKFPQFHWFRHGTCRRFILLLKYVGKIVIIIFYVDEISLAGNDEDFVANFVDRIARQF